MTKVIEIGSESQLNQLKKENTIVVIDFFATWCGPCKAIAPAYGLLAEQLSETGKMVFVKVDTDKQQAIARSHDISAMPTFVIFKDGAETDRIRGADGQKLQKAVKDLLAHAGGNAIASSSSSSSSTWAGGDIPRNYKVVNSEIDVKGLDCMNWKSELGNARTLFDTSAPSTDAKGGGKGKGKGTEGGPDWMESDTDEQLMLFIPFSSVVKVFQLQITSRPPPSDDDDDEAPRRPRNIKIYTNNAHILGFDEAESKEPIQSVELSESDWNDNGTAVINTRFVKFQAVSTLTLFIVDAEGGAESVRVDRIRIVGETGEKKEIGKLEKVGDDQ
ncbi:Thioredoxin [Dactylellina cionopaga]|nr:Thioredoxin [Dactylellina cionopaga]